jgi:hypothetical protein
MDKPKECYLPSQYPVPFLRLETPRQRLALPYATLLAINLADDDTLMRIDFASHHVTVQGKRLYEIYCALSAGTCAALFAQAELQELEEGPGSQKPVIHDLRIKASKAETNSTV